MKTPSVLVMETDSLLKRALINILHDASTDFSVYISPSRDLPGLIGEISTLHPDVVLLAESTPLSVQNNLAQIMAAWPGLRLIVVSPESNWLHIFQREDRLLTSLPDFLRAINSD